MQSIPEKFKSPNLLENEELVNELHRHISRTIDIKSIKPFLQSIQPKEKPASLSKARHIALMAHYFNMANCIEDCVRLYKKHADWLPFYPMENARVNFYLARTHKRSGALAEAYTHHQKANKILSELPKTKTVEGLLSSIRINMTNILAISGLYEEAYVQMKALLDSRKHKTPDAFSLLISLNLNEFKFRIGKISAEEAVRGTREIFNTHKNLKQTDNIKRLLSFLTLNQVHYLFEANRVEEGQEILKNFNIPNILLKEDIETMVFMRQVEWAIVTDDWQQFRKYRKKITNTVLSKMGFEYGQTFLNDAITMIKKHGSKDDLVDILKTKIEYLENFDHATQEQKVQVSIAYSNLEQSQKNLEALNQLTDEIRSKNKTLEERNKWLYNFAHIVAHDLKAPVRSISQILPLLLSGSISEERAQSGKQIVATSAKQMTELIDSLLAFSKSNHFHGEKQRLSIENEIDILLQVIHAEWQKKDARLIRELNVSHIETHQAPFRQILQNLILNAINYSKKDIKPIIRLRSYSEPPYVILEVQDNGKGIPGEELTQIFMPLKRGSSSKGTAGSGLGLSTVKMLIEELGGAIRVMSEVGAGTTFILRFPKVDMKAESLPEG